MFGVRNLSKTHPLRLRFHAPPVAARPDVPIQHEKTLDVRHARKGTRGRAQLVHVSAKLSIGCVKSLKEAVLDRAQVTSFCPVASGEEADLC